ncbi:iron-containing redox enzyme family protein [Photobacterium leiognathi]|uniref:iron-containing redox enzyme family protein n=1 Tax=Photobacterium leiognathi TaxID=553611 RepID=UPI002980B9A2|nr:iron-containing redox enzyme family protein [Photobacterium leiognathi]
MSELFKLDQLSGTLNIKEALEMNQEMVNKLANLTNILDKLSEDRLSQEKNNLDVAISQASGYTKEIIEHAITLHTEYVSMVSTIAEQGKITKSGLTKYFIQGWYHTSYTTRFEKLFTARLEGNHLNSLDSDHNKFAKLNEHDIDEEEGHELWALQDVLFLKDKNEINILEDVFSETKAIVGTQHDRLSRLPAVGFLGYSFYLEFLIATQSIGLLSALNRVLGTSPADHKFIYYHYLVDQGHAVDNIQLLDRMVRSEEDYQEVIDNMNLIHTLYSGLTERSFRL